MAVYDWVVENEIERKFFVKSMPDLSSITPIHYERYILRHEDGIEQRISKKGDKYIFEKKVEVTGLERTREVREITKEEFEKLKQGASQVIIRDRYDISAQLKISIQVYHGDYEGLVRAEVEFESEEQAMRFQPLEWMGKEMTGLPIARDAKLLDLTEEEFRIYLT